MQAKVISISDKLYKQLARIKKVESLKRGYTVSYGAIINELLESRQQEQKEVKV